MARRGMIIKCFFAVIPIDNMVIVVNLIYSFLPIPFINQSLLFIRLSSLYHCN